MIIQTKADCKNYSKIVRHGFHGGKASKGEFRCDNPNCRCDVFYIHGSYERKVLSLEQFSEKSTVCFVLPGNINCYVETLELLRVRCAGCGVTHAIVPVDMIPFCSFSLSLVLLLIMNVYSKDNPKRQDPPPIPANTAISWHVYMRILLTYKEYRDRMMAALRQKGLHKAAADLPDTELIKSYEVLPPPCEAHRAFLCAHRRALFVHRQNTVSYPLRFLVPLSLG